MANDKKPTGQGHGQDKTYDLTGTNPTTGEPLPPRAATQREWREEKLGQQGYQKPEDLPEEDETEAGDEGEGTQG